MIPSIARNFIYRPFYVSRGVRIEDIRGDIRRFHGLDREQMIREQAIKVSQLIKFLSRNNEYYRQLFDKHGYNIEREFDSAAFARLPFLTKQALRENTDRMLSSNGFSYAKRKTSGSTGFSLSFIKDEKSLALADALMYEVYSWHGITMGDRQARIWAMPLGLRGNLRTRIRDYLLNRRRLDSFDISSATALHYYKKMQRYKPKYMYGLPNTISELANLLLHAGYDPRALQLELIITTGEIQREDQREFIERSFGCDVYNEYGSTEFGIISFECRHKRKHLMMYNLYCECIDPESGRRVEPGGIGEVVITDLHSLGLPLIRYRLGDLIRLAKGRCACGLELPLVEEIVGKVSDLILTPQGKKISPTIFPYAMTRGISRFRAYQKSIGLFEIFVERGPNFENNDLRTIEDRLRSHLGKDVSIRISIVDKIQPEQSGKHRYFISEVTEESETK